MSTSRAGVHITPQPMHVAEVLRECVVESGLDCSFLVSAMLHAQPVALSVLAIWPSGAKQLPIAHSPIRGILLRAIEGRRQLTVVVPCTWHDQSQYLQVVVATPVILHNQRVWGCILTTGRAPIGSQLVIPSLEAHAEHVSAAFSPILTPLPKDRPEIALEDLLCHELRVPLSAASHMLDTWLRMSAGASAPDNRLLELAHVAVQEAQALLNARKQLQELASGPIAVAVVPLSLPDVVDRALSLLEVSAEEVTVEASPNLPLVAGHTLWLGHALINLLENAIKYSTRERAVEICMRARGGEVLVTTTSWGRGVAPEEQQTVFEPYQRGASSNRTEGQGLGLSIVRRCVRLLGGDIWMESDGETFTTVAFTLPVVERASERSMS